MLYSFRPMGDIGIDSPCSMHTFLLHVAFTGRDSSGRHLPSRWWDATMMCWVSASVTVVREMIASWGMVVRGRVRFDRDECRYSYHGRRKGESLQSR